MLGYLLFSSQSVAQAVTATAGAGTERADLHDGQHEFDFDFGTWKTHSSRLLDPLTGSTTWTDMDGVTVVTTRRQRTCVCCRKGHRSLPDS